jgi:short-subunit dehydrogenase
MAVSLKPLDQQVIVITGASSGIGLATAESAAKQGAKLVLAARSEQTLHEIVQRINSNGGDAIYVTADVSDRQQVQGIAEAAVQRFGRIDTWINDAGLSIYGRLEDVSEADSRRLFDINFWGVVNGSLVALPFLKRQGGALINVGSEVSDAVVPLQGMYSASKHAVKGFTDALRMELEADGAPVSVTLIRPAAINTPFPQHAKNYFDREPKLPPPVYAPEEVAKAILHAASHRERDVFVGGASRMFATLAHQAPRLTDWVNERMLIPQHFRDEPPRDPAGALHRAGFGGRIHGDHPGHVMKTSMYTRAARHPLLTGALAVAAGVAVGALMGGGAATQKSAQA